MDTMHSDVSCGTSASNECSLKVRKGVLFYKEGKNFSSFSRGMQVFDTHIVISLVRLIVSRTVTLLSFRTHL